MNSENGYTTTLARMFRIGDFRRVCRLSSFIVLFSIVFTASNTIAAGRIGGAILMGMGNCCPSEAWLEAEDAIISELQLDNIPVVRVDSEASNPSARLDEMLQVAEKHGASAIIRISKTEDESIVLVDLWLIDSITGGSSFRRLKIDQATTAASTLDAAVRTVEALRATFLETLFTEEHVQELAKPIVVPPDYPRFGVATEGVFEVSPGGVGPRGGFSLSAILEPVKNLDLELGVIVSPFGEDLGTETATSTLDYLIVKGLVFYRFTNKSIVVPAVGIGGGALLAWSEGSLRNGTKLKYDRDVVALLGGGVRIYIRLNDALFMFLGSFAAVAMPEVVASHGGETAATLGRPLVDATFGLRLRFP